MLHKIHPVRSGARLSLVMWFLGSDQGFWHAAEHSYKQASRPVAEGGHGPEFIPAKQVGPTLYLTSNCVTTHL